MEILLVGLQILSTVILMGFWWVRILNPQKLAPVATWQKLEAAAILGIIIFSCLNALRVGIHPWLELWYAEQIASVMIGATLMTVSVRYYTRLSMRILIGIGICGWLVMATKASLYHHPIWF